MPVPAVSTPDLWSALRTVARLRFEATCIRPPEWNGTGVGGVRVEAIGDSALVFHESGRWTLPGGRELPFSNVFRWTRCLGADARGAQGNEPAGLRLEHLRFGPAEPVFLFELTPQTPGQLVSREPHRCGEDLYAGALRWAPDRVELEWRLSGSRKQGTIRYLYLPS